MTDRIPENVPDLIFETSDTDHEHERLELEVLTLEARNKTLENREFSQRQIIRWIAVATGLTVIISMLFILGHDLHHLVWWGPILRGTTMFSVALIVAPTLAITTITIAQFIGAFKKFDDKDAEHAATGMSAGLNFLRGGP